VKSQGRYGEVAAELHTDFPERFAERSHLYGLAPRGERRELELQRFWPHKGRIILKFRGVDSISLAEELVGWEVQIPAEQRAELALGQVYVSDLLGCELIADGRELGKIVDVEFGAGSAPLLVVRELPQAGKAERKAGAPQVKEYLLPFAEEFVVEVDTAAKRVRLKLPEGLLDLDAPVGVAKRPARKKQA